MRQVPQNLEYLIVGNGRVATHLNEYLSQSSLNFLSWNRRQHPIDELKALIHLARVTLICIPDREIVPFCQEFKSPGKIFVHFSGSLETDLAFGFHPLMTFGHQTFSSEKYLEIPFVGTHGLNDFKTTFPQLKNLYFTISPEHKALYHSLCVLSGNGTTLLWELIKKEFAKMNLPEEVLNPYIQQITQNLISKDEGRLTGPWYRKDQETIDKNLISLKETPFINLYADFLNLAQSGGLK